MNAQPGVLQAKSNSFRVIFGNWQIVQKPCKIRISLFTWHICCHRTARMLKALTQYQECSGDPRVIPVIEKYLHGQLAQLPGRPLRDWGKFRWQDELLTVIWLYNRTGAPWLLDLAHLLQAQGYPWMARFNDFHYTHPITADFLKTSGAGSLSDLALATHGVNNGQAIKAGPVWSLRLRPGFRP